MKRESFVIALLIVAGLTGQGLTAEANGNDPSLTVGVLKDSQSQKTETVVPLEGLDPVMLIQGKEVMGKKDFSVTRGRFEYWFANAKNKAKFEKEPARYEIQMGGQCPVVPTATGDPDRFLVYKERIYIFATDGCVEEFKASPESFVKP
ncbi:MAG: hypothetical protein L0229_05830 [Blastocatellia bacterium]|nr:hypothetical protein [Blastocatellia bacterium]